MWEKHLLRMWISWAGEVRAGGCVTPRYSHTLRSFAAERKHCQVQTVYLTVYRLVWCCYIMSHSSKQLVTITIRPVIKSPTAIGLTPETSHVTISPPFRYVHGFKPHRFINSHFLLCPCMSYVHAKRSSMSVHPVHDRVSFLGMQLCRWFRFAQLAKGKKFRP